MRATIGVILETKGGEKISVFPGWRKPYDGTDSSILSIYKGRLCLQHQIEFLLLERGITPVGLWHELR